MPINWNLAGGGNNALAMFGVGAQMGQNLVDRREQREDRNALLAQRQQQIDLQTREQAQQAQAQQQQQRRADLPMLGKLLDYAQDEPTYQRARQVAQEYGVDVSGLPPAFDPNWIAQQRQVVQLMQTQRGQEALSTAGKQAQDAGYRPGTPEFTTAVRQIITADMAQPYTGAQGETRLYQPDVFGGGQQPQQAGPQPGAVEDGYRFRGGNPADPSAWEPVGQGGPTQSASAGFPGR